MQRGVDPKGYMHTGGDPTELDCMHTGGDPIIA